MFDAPNQPFAVPIFPGSSVASSSREGAGLPAVKPSETVRQFYVFVQDFRVGDAGWVYRCVEKAVVFRLMVLILTRRDRLRANLLAKTICD